MTAPQPIDRLAADTRGAWNEYLAATHNQPMPRYLEVEPWAWSRLQAVLKNIATRRRVVIEDDGA